LVSNLDTMLDRNAAPKIRNSFHRRARKYAKEVQHHLVGVLGVFRAHNVAMFHVGRVGSMVLATMLGQHRRIYWPGEVFEKEHSRYMKAVDVGTYTLPTTLPTDPLKILRTEMRAAGHRTFGFEMKFLEDHHLKVIGLELEGCIDALSKLGFDRYVVLTRRNLLRRLVSGAVLRKTGQAHIPISQERQKMRFHFDLRRVPIGANYYDLVDAIKLIEEGYARLSRALIGKTICELIYEDHISNDPLVAYRKLIAFMQLEPAAPKVMFRRTNPDPLDVMIENYDEIRARLEDTPYKWMLAG
jgi:hypothetical protein